MGLVTDQLRLLDPSFPSRTGKAIMGQAPLGQRSVIAGRPIILSLFLHGPLSFRAVTLSPTLSLPVIESPSGDRIISCTHGHQTNTIWFLSPPGKLQVPDWPSLNLVLPSALIMLVRSDVNGLSQDQCQVPTMLGGAGFGLLGLLGLKDGLGDGMLAVVGAANFVEGLKEKSPIREEDSQGICLPPVSL